jgi:hypothetical protein
MLTFETGVPILWNMGSSRSEMDVALGAIAISGIAETATHELVRAQLRKGDIADIRTACEADPHWATFVRLASEGNVPENWLPGALGACVLGWARESCTQREE